MTTCRFLENLTLASLISPFPKDDFRTHYWEQKPLIVPMRDPDFYGDLFTLKDFDAAIARAPDHVNTANAGANKKGVAHRGNTVKGIEAVLADMRDGHTLMLDRLNECDPKLGLFCRLLGPELGSSFQTNLYLTPPHGQGSFPHWDAAECGEVPSLHITFGVRPFFLQELLGAAIKAAVQRDERWRTALPLGFMHGQRERVVRRAMAALREITDETFLGAVVDQFREEIVETFPLDVSGQVEDFYQPAPIGLGDSVGPRRGIVYQVHVDNDSVRLNYGARSIVFPGFFQDALNFSLRTPAFAVRDLPGELQDEERVAFIERLMQEGLVVRMQDRKTEVVSTEKGNAAFHS